MGISIAETKFSIRNFERCEPQNAVSQAGAKYFSFSNHNVVPVNYNPAFLHPTFLYLCISISLSPYITTLPFSYISITFVTTFLYLCPISLCSNSCNPLDLYRCILYICMPLSQNSYINILLFSHISIFVYPHIPLVLHYPLVPHIMS